ncbi:hypothetical protein HW132_17485 [Brasilonema sp. CT11]|nr:hypothetical protein [Brasilonema sp. CT11]
MAINFTRPILQHLQVKIDCLFKKAIKLNIFFEAKVSNLPFYWLLRARVIHVNIDANRPKISVFYRSFRQKNFKGNQKNKMLNYIRERLCNTVINIDAQFFGLGDGWAFYYW